MLWSARISARTGASRQSGGLAPAKWLVYRFDEEGRVFTPPLLPKRADQPERSEPEFGYVEGLLYKFIRTISEASRDSVVTSICRKNQDRQMFEPRYFAESAQNLKPMNTGHLKIQNEEIECALAKAG